MPLELQQILSTKNLEIVCNSTLPSDQEMLTLSPLVATVVHC